MMVPGIADFLELLVVVLVAGLRADHGGFHAEHPKNPDERKRLERAADVDRRLLADELLAEALHLGINFCHLLAHEFLGAGHDVRVVLKFLPPRKAPLMSSMPK